MVKEIHPDVLMLTEVITHDSLTISQTNKVFEIVNAMWGWLPNKALAESIIDNLQQLIDMDEYPYYPEIQVDFETHEKISRSMRDDEFEQEEYINYYLQYITPDSGIYKSQVWFDIVYWLARYGRAYGIIVDTDLRCLLERAQGVLYDYINSLPVAVTN